MSDNPNLFAVGDTVRIANIVGPRMVVTAIDREKGIHVRWFNRRNEMQRDWINPRFLAKASLWEDRPRTPYGADDIARYTSGFEEAADGAD